MKGIVQNETIGAVVVFLAAAAAYLAEIDFLPSILLFVTGILATGAFSEEEDVLLIHYKESQIESHNEQLIMMRMARATVLMIIGVLMFAALGRQI